MKSKFNARTVLVAVLLVGLLETLTIAVLHRLKMRNYGAAIVFSQIQAVACRLDALEWKAMARGRPDPELREEVARRRSQMDGYLEKLTELAQEPSRVQSIRALFTTYLSAMDQEFTHLDRDELEQARWQDDQRVDPAYHRLQSALRSYEQDCEASGRKLSQWNLWGTFLSLLTTIGAIVILLRYFLRTQEKALQAEANQRLLAEYQRTEGMIRQLNEQLENRVEQRTSELHLTNQRLAAEMQERHRLEQLLMEVSEQEKQRLGQDLHDGVGQLLTGVALRSKALEMRLHTRPEAQDVSRVTELVAEALRMTRNLAWLLYPVELEKQGLAAATRALAAKIDTQFGVACEFEGHHGIDVVETDVAINLYRIAQEAATNALRHGRPTRIVIRLRQDADRALLEVENDGLAIGAAAQNFNGMGCRIMRHRASLAGATLRIWARPEGGCVVQCAWPAAQTEAVPPGAGA